MLISPIISRFFPALTSPSHLVIANSFSGIFQAMVSLIIGVLCLSPAANALSLSNNDALLGMRAALEKGTGVAIGNLGRVDGFLSNPKVRIQLPEPLNGASKIMTKLGQGQRVDELVTAMNRAAEKAVPQTKTALISAIKSMTVEDAKAILTGGETSVTDFFAQKTRAKLTTALLPIVTKQTEKAALTPKYDKLAIKASRLGLMQQQDNSLAAHVTNKTLDALYLMIGEEEKRIRQDPIGAGSAILKKVFGAL